MVWKRIISYFTSFAFSVIVRKVLLFCLSICLFVLPYSDLFVFVLPYYFVLLFLGEHFFKKERERKGVDLDGRGGKEELGGVGEGKGNQNELMKKIYFQ